MDIHDHEVKLNEREELILQAVVQSYITTAERVGSRAIVKRYNLDFSPATVRNVMPDLTDYGFLQQLHTSSGRVPTDRGYRYYVNHLMKVQSLTRTEQQRMEEEFAQHMSDTDAIMQHTSHLLAMVSHHAGIVEAPDESSAQVSRIELMPMGSQRLAVLIADTYGRVHSMIIEHDRLIDEEQRSRVNRFLNENLQGVAIDRLAPSVESRVREYIDEQRRVAEDALTLLGMLPQHRPGQLFLEGTTYLFEQPEFHSVDKAREVFNLLEEKEQLTGLLRESITRGDEGRAHIIIGSETSRKGLNEISLISAPYRIDGKPVGMIGVLGPRRMQYPKLTALVDYTADMLGRLLTRLAS